MDIDWTAFDGLPEYNCHCTCGEVFKSHAKYVRGEGLIIKNACPECHESNHCRRITSDKETMEI